MSKTPQKSSAKAVKKPVKSARLIKKTSPVGTKTKKPRSSSKSAKIQSQPLSMAALQTKITTLQSSLKRNDTQTKKRVSTLEASIAALETQSLKSNTAQKAALTRKVNQLSAKLTAISDQTRASVNKDLKTALSTSTDTAALDEVLSHAQTRLTQSEQMQAQAVAKINRHLAAIASAVDTRFEAVETQLAELQANRNNEPQNDGWQAETTTRLDMLEQDTATALGRVGDKMSEITQELSQQSEIHTLSIREKVSELAQQTQAEFEQYRNTYENRLENVEAVSRETPVTRRLEQTIAALSARIEGLEYDLAQRGTAEAVPAPAEGSSSYDDPYSQDFDPQKPQLSLVPTAPQPAAAYQDAFSPPQTQFNDTQTPPNPYLQAAQLSSAPAVQGFDDIETIVPVETPPPAESHIPQEYTPAPNPYAAAAQTTGQNQPQNIAAEQPYTPIEEITAQPAAPIAAEIPPMAAPILPEAAPYADPAYAETDAGLMNDRIIDSEERKLSLPKIGGLSGRNMKVAAMATGVAVVGLLAAKTFLGSAEPQLTTQDIVNNTTIEAPTTAVATPSAKHNTLDPIGEYEDNQAPTPVTGEAATTLNAAAASGDPVAQFQLGLSYLEQGRTDEGVSLIRKAANQKQPAAQYRLAKLYEIGEGVSQDAEMARQLAERAARNGNRIAMHDLALYYAEGRGGVTADLETASQWFEKAAQRGVVDSQFNLGVLFESGQGLPKNATDAFVWYSIAAAQGDQFAKKRIEVLSSTLPEAELEAAKLRVAGFKPVKIDDTANGIFRNVTWGEKADTQAADKSQDISQVRQVQALLNDLGYDIGGADGAIGPRTRAAIINFERVNGLPETGRVNTALISRLELAAGA